MGATLAGKALVPFEADTSGLLSTISGAVGDAGKMFGSMVPLAIIGGIAAAGAAVVDLASKYQNSTALMAANSNITLKQAALIGQAFLSTGGQTTFTAQEMMTAFAPVSGQLELLNGKALTAAQSMAFMSAAMALAEATGQPLSSTVASLASVMQSYAIPVADAAKASDLLYNVSRSLDMPISSVASAVDKLHAKLGPLAPSLTDVGTLLLDVASHGLTGSRALMLVTTGMNTLLGGTKPTNAELKLLGINLYDASGKFVGMQSVIGQLEPKLAGMTEAQRLAAEKTLFGASASKALDDTIMAGLPAWDKAAAAADKTGTAQAGAKTATDTLAGSFDRIKAAAMDFATKAGMVLLPVVAAVAANIIPVITAIANWVQSLHGLSVVVGVVFGGIKAIVTDVVNWIVLHWAQIAADTTVAWNIVTSALIIAWNIITSIIHTALQIIVPIVTVAWNVISTVIGTEVTVIIAIVRALDTAITAIWNAIKGWLIPLVQGIAFAITLAFTVVRDTLAVIWSVISSIIRTVWGAITTVFTTFATTIGGIFTGIRTVLQSVWTGITQDVSGAWNGIVNVIKGAVNIIISIIDGIIGGINKVTGAIPLLGSKLQIPLIPTWHAAGGFFDRPTVIGVGESGPEVVLNRPQLQAMMAGAGGSGSGGTGDGPVLMQIPAIHVHGLTAADVVPAINQQIGIWHGKAIQLARAKARH